MTTRTLCPVCQGRADVMTRTKDVEVGRWSTRVETELFVCEKCGEEFMSPDQTQAMLEKAAAQVRDERNLISPDRIRGLRERYGLTQEALERLLGVGPKTVARWERGAVLPTLAANQLLELLDGFAPAMLELASKVGVRLSASSFGSFWAGSTPLVAPTPDVPSANLLVAPAPGASLVNFRHRQNRDEMEWAA